MGIISTNKTISQSKIGCGETFKISLGVSASPDLKNRPKDIMLVLDRSGSMQNEPLNELKAGVFKLLDILDKESDGDLNGTLGNGNRVGLVSFSNVATLDNRFTDDINSIKASVNTLVASNSTNHKDAFLKALLGFEDSTVNEKILILFTDGESNKGSEGFEIAKQAKDRGITIYSIGYGAPNRIDKDALVKWASAPSTAHAIIIPSLDDIQDIFVELVRNSGKDGAKNIAITDTVSKCFKIISFDTPTKGSATILNNNQILWTMGSIGTTALESAEVCFTVQHTGNCTGPVEVNEKIDYLDASGNIVDFPSPIIDIDCQNPDIYEICPEAKDINADSCEDIITFDAGDILMNSLGRILNIDFTLKNICPNKRVAAAIIISEIDGQGNEYPRGMKTVLIPEHTEKTCKDITVRGVKFVLPEELDKIGEDNSICNQRSFRARVISNYIDNNFYCENN